jgi:hypothetical protein
MALEHRIVDQQKAVAAVLRAFGPLHQALPVGVQQGDAVGGLTVWFVGHIVGGAGKGVDGGHVRPQRPGQEARGHREVLVMRPRQPLAGRIGGCERGWAHHRVSLTPAR